MTVENQLNESRGQVAMVLTEVLSNGSRAAVKRQRSFTFVSRVDVIPFLRAVAKLNEGRA